MGIARGSNYCLGTVALFRSHIYNSGSPRIDERHKGCSQSSAVSLCERFGPVLRLSLLAGVKSEFHRDLATTLFFGQVQ